jgi:hypothetical protein
MGIRIHELEDGADNSDGLSGNELIEVSRPSPTVYITGTTISAVVNSDGGSFADSGDGFIGAGFIVGDSVRVQGFTSSGNNVFSARITTLADGLMTFAGADGDAITDEAAGDFVTITRWESRRVTADDLAEIAGAGAPVRDAVSALSISSGVVNINCALGDYFTLALTANVTSITFSNLPGSGKGASLMLRITQDTTPRTVAWPASFRWAGGVAGAVSTGSGAIDLLAITTLNNGTTWHATLAKGFA